MYLGVWNMAKLEYAVVFQTLIFSYPNKEFPLQIANLSFYVWKLEIPISTECTTLFHDRNWLRLKN